MEWFAQNDFLVLPTQDIAADGQPDLAQLLVFPERFEEEMPNSLAANQERIRYEIRLDVGHVRGGHHRIS